MMRLTRIYIAAAALAFLCLPMAAIAVPAGTVVDNTATLNYSTGAGNIQVTSSDSFTVHELLAHSLLWQDIANVPVQSGDTSRVLTYDLFNNGNGLDQYSLVLNTGIAGNDFDPVATIYLDINNSGSYDAGDQLYTPGSVTPAMAEGGSIRIFVVADIPAGLSDGNTGAVELTAISNSITPPVASGTVIAGAGDSGTDLVVSMDDATALTQASFIVSSYVTMLKSFVINSPGGGTSPMPGATVEYTITVTMSGSGSVNNLVVTDTIPANTTYQTGSIYLDGVSKLDGLDADEADYGQTAAGAVSVILGTMNGGDPPREIRFTVTIN